MAIQDKNTLKSWFLRGMKPLANQFADWLDSYWHKDENIPADKIEGMQHLLDMKADLETVNNQFNEVNNTIETLQSDIAERDRTGQFLPVHSIIANAPQTEIRSTQLSPILTANSSIAAIEAAYNAGAATGETLGTIALNGIATTTSSKPAGYTRGLKLSPDSSIEFSDLPDGVIKNLTILYYAGGSNRWLDIFVDDVPTEHIQLNSSGHQTLTLPDVGKGVLKLAQGGSNSNSFNIWDIQFDVEKTAATALPENADAGTRVILEGGNEDEDRIYEFDGENWNEQAAVEGISLRVLSNNCDEYTKINGHFVPKGENALAQETAARQTADENTLNTAKAYIDEQLNNIVHTPQAIFSEQLPFTDKTSELDITSSNAPDQSVEFDFAAGNLTLDFAGWSGDTLFDLNIATLHVQRGDVRYLTIKGSDNNNGFSFENLKIDDVYYGELNDAIPADAWKRTDSSPEPSTQIEEKIWVLKFVNLGGLKIRGSSYDYENVVGFSIRNCSLFYM